MKLNRKWIGIFILSLAVLLALPIPGLPGYALFGSRGLLASAHTLQEENTRLNDEIKHAQHNLDIYIEDAGRITAENQQLAHDLDQARMLGGLTSLEGPGVVVEIRNKLYGGKPDPFLRMQDQDLLLLLNELNAAGAEAVSINGQRVIATTEIRNAGPYIAINTQSMSVPFTLYAIGDANTLLSAMNLYGGVVDNLRELFDIRCTRSEQLTVPAYEGVVRFRFGKPASGEGG